MGADSLEGDGCHVPDDGLHGMWERLLTDPDGDVDLDADWDADRAVIPDWLPPEWDDAALDEPVLAYGRCTPSGWLALDLDSATTDPARLSDDTLVEAMVGFDRVGSWAAARQARLLAELARSPPHLPAAPYSARWAGVGSEYAPDRGRGRAAPGARDCLPRGSGLACRLLATLPDNPRVVGGRADRCREGPGDRRRHLDAVAVEVARAVQDRGAAPGAGADPGPAPRRLWLVR